MQTLNEDCTNIMLKKIENAKDRLNSIVCGFLAVFLLVMLVGAIFVKAFYRIQDDWPVFVANNYLDVMALIIIIAFLLLLIHYRNQIEARVKYWVLWLVFGAIGIAFVLLVPLIPFSDMTYVASGAEAIAEGDYQQIFQSEYLQYISKNLKVSAFYGVLLLFLPKNLMSLKIINVVLYLLIIFFISKSGENLKLRYPKVLFILGGTYLPLLLYCNHIYFDLPVLCFTMLGIWIFTKKRDNYIWAMILIGIGASLRIMAVIAGIAITIDFIFNAREKIKRKVIILLVGILLSCGIVKTYDASINALFRVENARDESIWSLFCIGINEEKFGFMNPGYIDGSETFETFIGTLTSRTPEQNLKLFTKKIFWTWTQGTFQAQRYAFGLDAVVYTEKFEYETILTKCLMTDEGLFRRFINSFCRAQYLIWMGLTAWSLWKMSREKRRDFCLLYYIMFGTFLILIFYEMKSRYIFNCIPGFLILGMVGLEFIIHHIENRNMCTTRGEKEESDI